MKENGTSCVVFHLQFGRKYTFTYHLWFKKEPVALKASEDFLKSKILTGLSSSLNFLMSPTHLERGIFGHLYFILFNQVLIAIN